MGRLFVYDENMTDERAKITVAKMAAVSDIVASEKAFIQYSAAGQLTVLAGAVIAVGDAIFQTEETTLSAANLDGASSFAHGKDYYIYLCNNGKDSSNEVYSRTAWNGTIQTPVKLAVSTMALLEMWMNTAEK